MAARAAIRDTGRALGFAYGFCDQVAKMSPFRAQPGQKSILEKSLKEVTELGNLLQEARRITLKKVKGFG